jgi:hypothetical protein
VAVGCEAASAEAHSEIAVTEAFAPEVLSNSKLSATNPGLVLIPARLEDTASGMTPLEKSVAHVADIWTVDQVLAAALDGPAFHGLAELQYDTEAVAALDCEHGVAVVVVEEGVEHAQSVVGGPACFLRATGGRLGSTQLVDR